MSWAVSIIGHPDKICDELDSYGANLIGQTKIEFNDMIESLKTLVCQNFSRDPSWHTPILQLEASGYGCQKNGEQVQRDCSISIKRLYTKLV